MIFKKGILPSILIQDRSKYRRLDEDLIRYLNDQLESLNSIFRNGVSFADNIDCEIISFISDPSIGVETAVSHSLKRVPTGFIVISCDQEAIVYDGTTANTISSIYIRASQSSVNLKIIVF